MKESYRVYTYWFSINTLEKNKKNIHYTGEQILSDLYKYSGSYGFYIDPENNWYTEHETIESAEIEFESACRQTMNNVQADNTGCYIIYGTFVELEKVFYDEDGDVEDSELIKSFAYGYNEEET